MRIEGLTRGFRRCPSLVPGHHDIDIKGWVRPHASARETVPIYLAAVREGMVRMAGDVADGLIGHPMCSLRWLDKVLVANFEAGLARSGRDRSGFDSSPPCAARSRTTRTPRTRPAGARLPSMRPSAPMRRFGSCMASGRRRSRWAKPFASATSPGCPCSFQTRWSMLTARPGLSTRSRRGSRTPVSEGTARS